MNAIHAASAVEALCLVVSSFLVTCAGCDRAGDVPPGVYLTPTEYDFGTAVNKESVKGHFTLTNTTEARVRIVNTEVSCGCTDLHISGRVIEPRGSVTLTLSADVRGRSGVQVFEAVVITDCKLAPALRAQLRGHVVVDKIEGELPVKIGAFFPEAPIDEHVKLPSRGARRVTITRIRPDREGPFKLEVGGLKSTVVGSPFFALRVTGHAPRETGRFSIHVELSAEGADWKQGIIVIHGTVRSRWQYPKELYLGFVHRGETVHKQLPIEDIFGEGDRENVVNNVDVESDGIVKASAERTANKNNVVLSVSLAHTGTTGPSSSTLRVVIQMADGRQYVLRIPVYAYCL